MGSYIKYMNRSFALLVLLSASCAGEYAGSSEDNHRLREILDLASKGPAKDLRRRMEEITHEIGDAELRSKTMGEIGALVDASAMHQRIINLERDIVALGGVISLEPGGPAWMQAAAGDQAMHVFDRLVVLGLNDKTNPHFKGYKLNTKVDDSWLERVAGLPDLRSLDVANADVRGPGLRHVGTLRTLESVNLTLTPISDDALAALSGLADLKVLGLASTKITGTGLEWLRELRKLENLNCHSTPVNDAGLEQIGKLSSLKRLEIVHTQFTDAGTRALSGLVNLERLQLGSRRATGAGLSFLRDLTKLRELDVHDGLLTPEGFRHVGTVKSLRVFRAYGGSAGNEGLAALAGLSELETLILEGIGVTDAGLETLATLTHLRKLVLHEPKVTDAAVARLHAATPALEIAR